MGNKNIPEEMNLQQAKFIRDEFGVVKMVLLDTELNDQFSKTEYPFIVNTTLSEDIG